MTRAIVVGAGHNGLVCACTLAMAGLDVTVLEQSARPGGGSRTEETPQGHRFDTHSVAHNLINMTVLPRELGLAECGLRYAEMDPFAVAVFADGRRVRFHRSIERTLRSIAHLDAAEADAYGAFMERALPVIDLAATVMRTSGHPAAVAASLARRPAALRRVLGAGLGERVADLASPYRGVLETHLRSDLTRAPAAAFAAHAGASPLQPGSGLFALWQAAYHRFGQWHAVGGAQALIDALVERLRRSGGVLRCDAPVARIEARGRVRAVVLEGGERLPAEAVVAAIDPRAALLDLLEPPLTGTAAARLRAAHRGNAVQAVAHVVCDGLPPYADARPGDWNGLQSFVDRLDDLALAFTQAEAGSLPNPAPAYAFTPSAIDGTLAPAGRHTLYLATPAAPFRAGADWEDLRGPLAEDLLAQVERRAPGFRESVRAVTVRTPSAMARELRWPGAHPMHLDITIDQLGPLRPTPALGRHRTTVPGLFLGGAGAAPTGGVSGLPGRHAARAVLRSLGRRRSRPRANGQ